MVSMIIVIITVKDMKDISLILKYKCNHNYVYHVTTIIVLIYSYIMCFAVIVVVDFVVVDYYYGIYNRLLG